MLLLVLNLYSAILLCNTVVLHSYVNSGTSSRVYKPYISQDIYIISSFFLCPCLVCEQLVDDTEQQVRVRVWAGELRRG